MRFHSDYKDVLFSRGAIEALLKNAGFPLEEDASEGPEEDEPGVAQVEGWKKLYAAKSALRPYEAAWILSGMEPPTAYPSYYSITLQEQMRYLHVLEDLAAEGKIAFKITEWHIDSEPGTWMLDHQSVVDWCRSAGYSWPLEDLMPAYAEKKAELHPKREATYQRIIASLLAMQYSANELKEPYRLADQFLNDCQAHALKAPAGRSTLGPIIEELPQVQKAPLD
ncbi:hypothetical protein SAMN05421509_10164 [Chromohalobacter canadensis]|uniref:Uncharacterized protein n=1 Tax=Chromohalobacter canadensis TaxID=141389 RepID=A0A285VAL8_9GAMM|nr:hypothetical protein [Chromohalobacter canadensis]SOC51007.1 hypothetical protein SAMN05421509_10164 [Chromohalobacter canadensis]